MLVCCMVVFVTVECEYGFAPFCARCVYSKFGHHPQPLGYPCAKFRFFRGLRRWASPWRKNRVYSITHSLTHLIWCAGNGSAYASEYVSRYKVVSVLPRRWKVIARLAETIQSWSHDWVLAAEHHNIKLKLEGYQVCLLLTPPTGHVSSCTRSSQ